MTKVTSATFQREFGRYRTIAHREAVTVTSHGRDDLVVLSVEEYSRLKSLDRQALRSSELPVDVIEELGTIPIPDEASRFDDEFDVKN